MPDISPYQLMGQGVTPLMTPAQATMQQLQIQTGEQGLKTAQLDNQMTEEKLRGLADARKLHEDTVAAFREAGGDKQAALKLLYARNPKAASAFEAEDAKLQKDLNSLTETQRKLWLDFQKQVAPQIQRLLTLPTEQQAPTWKMLFDYHAAHGVKLPPEYAEFNPSFATTLASGGDGEFSHWVTTPEDQVVGVTKSGRAQTITMPGGAPLTQRKPPQTIYSGTSTYVDPATGETVTAQISPTGADPKVLGGAKPTGAGAGKTPTDPEDLLALYGEVRKQLKAASGSAPAAAMGTVGEFFGRSTPASAADATLKQLAAKLQLASPKFAGQVSNFEMQRYEQAVGNIGNVMLSRETRLAEVAVAEDILRRAIAKKKAASAAPAPGAAKPAQRKNGGSKPPSTAHLP